MKNKERLLNIEVNFNIDAVRAAASNAAKIQEIALEVPLVDPKDLSCEDQIFGIEMLPVSDKAKKEPDTTMYVAIKPIMVETLSNRVKPGFITVNGNIDIPKEGGRINKIGECYFTNQEHARATCRVITEVQLDRALEKVKVEQDNADFLQKQLNDDRF